MTSRMNGSITIVTLTVLCPAVALAQSPFEIRVRL
jgi:hypothetical protein